MVETPCLVASSGAGSTRDIYPSAGCDTGVIAPGLAQNFLSDAADFMCQTVHSAKHTAGRQRALSTSLRLIQAPTPHTKTSFVHLPPELHLAIFSHLPPDENLGIQRAYGTVSRAFRRASIAGCATVRDSISCGYFRSLFRRPGPLPAAAPLFFDATWLKLQTLDLSEAWTAVAADKQEYFNCLLAENGATLQNLVL